jgi:hypothetical protein
MAESADLSRPGAASPTVEELRQRIDLERRALDHSLDRLGGQVRETVDWRRQAARHKGKLLAAGGGLLLAGAWRWRRRRRPQARLTAALTRAADAVNREASEGFEILRRRLAPPPPRTGWIRHVLGPLAVAAVRAALAWRTEDEPERAGTARPTPPSARERERSAAWKDEEEDQQWSRKSRSTQEA